MDVDLSQSDEDMYRAKRRPVKVRGRLIKKNAASTAHTTGKRAHGHIVLIIVAVTQLGRFHASVVLDRLVVASIYKEEKTNFR